MSEVKISDLLEKYLSHLFGPFGLDAIITYLADSCVLWSEFFSR